MTASGWIREWRLLAKTQPKLPSGFRDSPSAPLTIGNGWSAEWLPAS